MRLGQAIDVVLAVMIAGGAAIAVAQSGGDGEKRGSVPPGTSRDGAKPADGAIVGGAIDSADPSLEKPSKEVERCKQLTGALREGCLRDLKMNRSPAPADQARSRNPETPARSMQ